MQKKVTFSPLAVFKHALQIWWKNVAALIAIYSLTLLLTHALKFYSVISREFYVRIGEWAGTVFTTVMYAAVFFLNSFFVLIIVYYFMGTYKNRLTFDAAFKGARETSIYYFKALLLYVGIVFTLIGFAIFFFVVGRAYFGPQSVAGVNMPALLMTSTVTVVLLITSFWYGFFFSLAPLIAAFESQGARVSLGISKSRIKHAPWRYLFVFLIFLGLYFFVGVIVYSVAAIFIGEKSVLGWIDPVMMAVWTPLWLGIWALSYQKLTDGKSKA
ncbi:MAG: hypothetical protein ABIC68_04875 [Candidatus Omnitrophota bacterium]